jgi:hypothetical protein
LEPVEYPISFPELAKANLLKKQAELMGWSDKYYRVPQTTRFEDGPNSTGVYMRASQLTGMDATGINDGSKSTTLVNYMSDAWNWGAEIFCNCEIRYVTKATSCISRGILATEIDLRHSLMISCGFTRRSLYFLALGALEQQKSCYGVNRWASISAMTSGLK